MKYMTFKNSCFFAAISNLLEDLDIEIKDEDIIRESLIPYIFEYDENTEVFSSGYQIQDFTIINDYLKQFIVQLNELKFTSGTLIERKRKLIESLTKTDTHKIVSLKMTSNKSRWHATIYTGMNSGKYRFINMVRSNNEIIDIELTYDELLGKLADKVQYAWLEKSDSFKVIDKRQILDNSHEILLKLLNKIKVLSSKSRSYENRLKHRDLLFRPLLLNYVDVSKIINENELSDDLSKIQTEYINSFKVKGDIILADYLDFDLLEKSVETIKNLIISKKRTTYFHGSKTSGISKLYPNVSIHDEKYVYLTTKREVALIYTVNAIESYFEKKGLEKPEKFHPWYSYGFSKGKLQIDEYYPNAFKETYKGKSGYLYLCSEPKQDISNKTNIFCAVTTKEDLSVIEEIFIDDLYKEFLELESKCVIEIRRYKNWTRKQIHDIENSINGTIEHFDLYNKPEDHYTVFLKEKFPKLFMDN